jgi:hypothetical protein
MSVLVRSNAVICTPIAFRMFLRPSASSADFGSITAIVTGAFTLFSVAYSARVEKDPT